LSIKEDLNQTRDLKEELDCDGQCWKCDDLDCKNHPINNDDEE